MGGSIDRMLGGERRTERPEPGHRFRFRVRAVRDVRVGEAKLCVRASGEIRQWLGTSWTKFLSPCPAPGGASRVVPTVVRVAHLIRAPLPVDLHDVLAVEVVGCQVSLAALRRRIVRADLREGFALRGVYFTRHDRTARFIFGQDQFAKTAAGA